MRGIAIALLLLFGAPAVAEEPLEVYFSPHGGCTEAIVKEIDHAKASIYALAYNFSSVPIGDALVAASKRGVHVEVVLDRSNLSAKGSELAAMRAAKIPTFIDSAHRIAHNKVLVIDGAEVETGSFNYSHSAEASNGENVVIIRDADLAAKYFANWQQHRAHSK